MIAESFFISATLAGMAVGLVDRTLVPVTWGDGKLASGTQFGSHAVVIAKCNVWRNSGNHWEVAVTSQLVIPAAMASSFTLGSEKGYALFAINSLQPATLVGWNIADMMQRDKVVTPRLVASLALDPAITAKITLKPDELLSVPDLPPMKWVFSPAVVINPEGGKLCAALHSFRGQGELWQIDDQGRSSSGVTLPATVDLHGVMVGTAMWALYREPPADWNSYSESAAGSLGPPKALPLILHSFDPKIADVNLTIKAILGLVYAADFVSLGNRGWLIAASGGPIASPFLRMILWDTEHNKIVDVGFVSLRVPPTQVVLRAEGKDAMCLARYPGPKGEEVCVLRGKIPG